MVPISSAKEFSSGAVSKNKEGDIFQPPERLLGRDLFSGGNRNVEMGFYLFGHRTDSGASGIHWNSFRRSRHRQVSVFLVPGDMPDSVRHWHIDREKDHVTRRPARIRSFRQR